MKAPKINELRLEDIWKKFKEHPKVIPYFPNYNQDTLPNARYLLNVKIYTI